MASAAAQQNAAFNNDWLLGNAQTLASGQLQDTTREGIGALGTGYGNARTDVTNQTAPTLAALGQGYATGNAALTQGYNTATGDINQGIAGYSPYIASGLDATTMRNNALGLNGAGGNTAATNAFHAGPGYQWNVDQATDAASRRAASLGIAGSGNTLSAITTLGGHLADQEYGSWLNNLNAASNQGLTAASGAAAGYNTLGSAAMNYGTAANANAVGQGNATGTVYQNLGSKLGTLDVGQGTGTASLYQGLGTSLSSLDQNIANGQARSNTSAAEATDAASNANDNLGLGLLGLGVKAGSSLLGSGGLSTIAGLFK